MKLLVVNGEYDGKNVIYHGRLEDGKKGKLIIPQIQPYFYVNGGEEKTIDGQFVRKVYVTQPTDVIEERKKYSQTWEADIPFVERNWVDKGYKKFIDLNDNHPTMGDFLPKKCYIDIEVDDSVEFPSPDEAKYEVLSVVFFDKYYNILTTGKVDSLKLLNRVGKLNFRLRLFDDERQLLTSLYTYFTNPNFSPDVVLGWNVDFDFKYLKNRMEKYGLKLRDEEYCVFDLLRGYERLHENEIQSLTLEYVANLEIGRGKVKRNVGVKKLWEEDRIEELFYNYMDVELIKELDEKLSIFSFFYQLSVTAGTLNINRWNASYIVDNLLLHLLHGRYVLPTNASKEKEEVEGAIVLEPQDGMFENVVVFDFNSEYPSIISTFNLSPDALVDGKIVLEKREGEKKGIIPTIIEGLVTKRKEIKEKLKLKDDVGLNNQQRVLKEITNSFYGLFGNEGYRLYNPTIQATITDIARKHLLYTKGLLEEMGYKVLYGDTDSIFVQWNSKIDVEKMLDIYDVVQKLNDSMENFTSPYGRQKGMLKVGLDGVFAWWFQGGVKKRYYGKLVWKDYPRNELYTRGYELRRSNASQYTKEKQRELMMVSFEGKQAVKEWYGREVDRWRSKTINLDDIAIIAGVRKNVEDYKTNNQVKKALERGRKEGLVDGKVVKFKLYLLKDGELAVDFFSTLPKKYYSQLDWVAHMRRCFVLPMEKIYSHFLSPTISSFLE